MCVKSIELRMDDSSRAVGLGLYAWSNATITTNVMCPRLQNFDLLLLDLLFGVVDPFLVDASWLVLDVRSRVAVRNFFMSPQAYSFCACMT